MSLLVLGRRLLPVVVTAGVLSPGAVAHAASVSLCISSKPNAAVTSPGTSGTCAAGSTAVALPASSTDQQTLLAVLPHMSFQASGVGGKPTIEISGVNVQVVNGSGSETTVNGEGNLVIGYNPFPAQQTGSHNLVMGTAGQNYTSFGGVLAGLNNHITAPEASVTGGESNFASGTASSISGGSENDATAFSSSVSGGNRNGAEGTDSSIFGGALNLANGTESAVSGGLANTASGLDSTAFGTENRANGDSGLAGGSLRQSISMNSSNWSTPGCCNSRAADWYTDDSGFVHLEGAVTQTNSNSVNGSDPNLIATLPAAASPPQAVYMIVHTLSGTYADLAISPSGQIFMIASPNTNPGFLSLEGITFRQ